MMLSYVRCCKNKTGGLDGKESPCHEGTQVQFLDQEGSLEDPTPVFSPGEFHG